MKHLLLVSSITYAYKARHLLQQNWIKCGIVRTPEQYTKRGCGYSLVLREDPQRAVDILTRHGIKVLQTVTIPAGGEKS